VAREDLLLAPESLEALIAGFADLAVALGPAASARLGGVRGGLERARTARDDGRRTDAVREILAAMRDLADLAAVLDPDEARAMRALASTFGSALSEGDAAHAAQSVDGMRKRSGAVKKRDDEFKL